MSQPILNFSVDAKAFNQAAEALFKKSSRTYPEFVNGQLYGLALKAMEQTEKGNRTKIEWQMGQIGNKVSVSKKTGKSYAGKRIVKEDSFAARIINARLRDAGKPMIWGPDLNMAVSRMIAARIRAIAFTKSGWLWAIRALAKYVKGQRGRRDLSAKIRGPAPKGSADPAKPILTGIVWGSITNTAIREAEAMPVAERGLVKALALQAANMLTELQRRIQKDIDSVK